MTFKMLVKNGKLYRDTELALTLLIQTRHRSDVTISQGTPFVELCYAKQFSCCLKAAGKHQTWYCSASVSQISLCCSLDDRF